jgi:hypothetical protein
MLLEAAAAADVELGHVLRYQGFIFLISRSLTDN